MSLHDRDDEARDGWLREALRHAPDAQATPPAALSAMILREARAKAPRAVVRRRTSMLGAMWSLLGQRAFATGLASLMVVTLAGVLWLDLPMEDAQTPPAILAPASPAIEERKAVVQKKPAAPPIRAAEPAIAAPPRAPAPVLKAPTADRAKSAATAPSLLTRAPQSQRTGAAAAPSFDDRVSESRAAGALETLRASLASESAGWSWQRGNGPVQPMTPALRQWIDSLDQQAGTRWTRVVEPPAADLRRPADAVRNLHLLRDGHRVETFEFDAGEVRWQHEGRESKAVFQEDALRALIDALDRAAR